MVDNEVRGQHREAEDDLLHAMFLRGEHASVFPGGREMTSGLAWGLRKGEAALRAGTRESSVRRRCIGQRRQPKLRCRPRAAGRAASGSTSRMWMNR